MASKGPDLPWPLVEYEVVYSGMGNLTIRLGQVWIDPVECTSWEVVGIKKDIWLSGPGSARGMRKVSRDELIMKWELVQEEGK